MPTPMQAHKSVHLHFMLPTLW